MGRTKRKRVTICAICKKPVPLYKINAHYRDHKRRQARS